MRHVLLCLCLLIAPQAFSGGLEPSKDEGDMKVTPVPAKSAEVSARAEAEANVKTTDAVAKIPDCRPPAGGNSVVNHGSVTNGGDSVNTKVVCSCESKPCKPKIIEKEVVRKVPGPVQVKKEIVRVPGPVQYIDRPCPPCKDKICPVCPKADCGDKDRNFTIGVLVGSGPDGVHPYKYDKEYRAREGRGILMGLDADYRFLDRFHVGGLYINNNTFMGRLGISF